METSEEQCLGTQLLTVLTPSNIYLGKILKQKFTDHLAEKLKKISKRKLPFCSNDNYNTRMQTFYKKVPHASRTMGSCNLGVQAVGLLGLVVAQISVELTWQECPSLLHESFNNLWLCPQKYSVHMPHNSS
jgi:hypothetical protein